jgi:hypothetical protein
MKVAYVFSTSGHTASYKLGKMILPPQPLTAQPRIVIRLDRRKGDPGRDILSSHAATPPSCIS